MFIDEVRARRGVNVEGGVQYPGEVATPPNAMSCEYQPREHLHPTYMEWLSHNEDTYFR